MLVVAADLPGVAAFSGIIEIGAGREEARAMFEFSIMRILATISRMRFTYTASQPFMALCSVLTVH